LRISKDVPGVYAAAQVLRLYCGPITEYVDTEGRQPLWRQLPVLKGIYPSGQRARVAAYEFQLPEDWSPGLVDEMLSSALKKRSCTPTMQKEFPSASMVQLAALSNEEKQVVLTVLGQPGGIVLQSATEIAKGMMAPGERFGDASGGDDLRDDHAEMRPDAYLFYDSDSLGLSVAGLRGAGAGNPDPHTGSEDSDDEWLREQYQRHRRRRHIERPVETVRMRDMGADSQGEDNSADDSDNDEFNVSLHGPHRLIPQVDRPEDFFRRLVPRGPAIVKATLLEDQKEDEFCKAWLGAIASGSDVGVSQTNGRGKIKLSSLAIVDGILMHVGSGSDGRSKLEYVIPRAHQEMLIVAAHDTLMHVAVKRVVGALRASGVWWYKMADTIHHYISNKCPTCAYNKVGKHVGEMHIPDKGYRPWEYVGVDLVHLEETTSGNCEAIVFSCRLTRAKRVFPVPRECDSRMFLNVLAFGLLPSKGAPRVLVSDRGSNIISAWCQLYYKVMGIKHIAADAHMHTAVGPNERFNATLREFARAAIFDGGNEWDMYCPWLEAAYNATEHAETGYSPFFLEHGRELDLPWHAVLPSDEYPKKLEEAQQHVRRHVTALHLAWDVARNNLASSESARKQRHDSVYRTNVKHSKGDVVLVLKPGPVRQGKMSMPYAPAQCRIIEGPDERDRYRLRDLEGRARHSWFHVSKLKPWPPGVEHMEDLGDDYYVIDKIVDVKKDEKGDSFYLVKWRGYSARHNSWVRHADLTEGARRDAHALLQARYGAPEMPRAPPDTPEDAVQATGDVLGRQSDSAGRMDSMPASQAGKPTATSREARAAARGLRIYNDSGVHSGVHVVQAASTERPETLRWAGGLAPAVCELQHYANQERVRTLRQWGFEPLWGSHSLDQDSGAIFVIDMFKEYGVISGDLTIEDYEEEDEIYELGWSSEVSGAAGESVVDGHDGAG